jgi:hypothetical protein
MPKMRFWAIMNSAGMSVIQAPAVALINPPFKMDNMPSVTTIDGMRV